MKTFRKMSNKVLITCLVVSNSLVADGKDVEMVKKMY